ncbi:MAG: hypothetical protein WCJ59_02360 [bacterium]
MITELTTTLFFMLSVLPSLPKEATAQTLASSSNLVNTEVKEQVIATKHPQTLEEYVRAYYADTPILAEIARCESTFRQFDSNGQLLRGKVNKDDIGLMQVNEYYHDPRAKKLNLDLHTIDGNLAYAKRLYEKEGTDPWISSSPCWGKFEKKLSTNKVVKVASK